MLVWSWKEKVGQADIQNGNRLVTVNLYQGNAYLIFIEEWEDENGKGKYLLHTFFADKTHMKRLLGLDKKGGYTENHLQDVKAIRLDANKCKHACEIVDAFIRANDDIVCSVRKFPD